MTTKKSSAGPTAGDIMQTNVVAVPSTTPLAEVAALLSEHRISGAPVTDEAGRVSGVISMRDLLDTYAQSPESHARRRHEFWATAATDESEELLSGSEIPDDSEETAGEIMTAEVHTVPRSAPVAEVARQMVAHRIR